MLNIERTGGSPLRGCPPSKIKANANDGNPSGSEDFSMPPMKKALKEEMLRKRNALSKSEIEEKSRIIREKLNSLPEFKKSKNILIYASFNNEVDTKILISELLENKEKNVLIPFVEKNNPVLQLSVLNNLDDLEPKTFGILEPKKDKIKNFDINKLDLVIVPGIAFDKNGHRIGYGYGYYDRFLGKLGRKAKKIGLCYDFQLIDKIPEEKHDVPMDFIVTEKRIINCAKK